MYVRASRNILCFPLQDERGSIVGVAELCNKLGSAHFSAQDEEIARAFSIYCCISLVQVPSPIPIPPPPLLDSLLDAHHQHKHTHTTCTLLCFTQRCAVVATCAQSLMYKTVQETQYRSRLAYELMNYHMQVRPGPGPPPPILLPLPSPLFSLLLDSRALANYPPAGDTQPLLFLN